jgi:tetratricopeptide (TPR) repeat protein
MVRYKELFGAEEVEQERLRQLDELLNRGLQQAQTGKGREALATFLDAVEKDPDNWWIHNYLALLYMSFGAPGQALRHIQRMLDLDSDASDGHYFMALYWYHQKAFSAALEYAETAKRLRPGKPELRMLLGDILVGLNRPQDGLQEYDAARKLAPEREIFQTRYTTLSKRLITDNLSSSDN